MFILTGHSAAVLDVAFSPGGDLLASASLDSTVRGWSLPGGSEVFRHTTAQSKAEAVAFAPDGSGLAAAYLVPGALVHWYRPPNATRATHTFTEYSPSGGIAFSPDGQLLYMSDGNEMLAVNAAGDVQFRNRFAHALAVSIAVSSTGELYALRQFGADVWVYPADLSSRRNLTIGPVAEGDLAVQLGLSVAPDGSRIAFTQGKFLAVWDGGRNKTPRTWIAHQDRVRDTAFVDAQTLLTVSVDGEVRTWDVLSGAQLASYDFAIGEVYCLAVAPGGLMAAAGGENGIAVWDLAD